jgi:hypothetical protein
MRRSMQEDGMASRTEAGFSTAVESQAAPWTETTRLLCAAAYTEATFAQEVVDELLEEDHRAVEVPPGVDPAPVLRHCVAASALKRRRDRWLAATLVVLVVVSLVTGSSYALFWLQGWAVVGYFLSRTPRRPARLQRTRRLVRWWLGSGYVVSLIALTVRGFVEPASAAGALCVLLAWGIVVYDLWYATYEIVKRQLDRRTFDPGDAPEVASPDLARRIDEIADRKAGNLTVYSGFLPFAGAGIDLGGWSFVVDLRKGREEAGNRLTPQPLEPLALYEGVDEGLRELRMPNLTIEDRAYVNGTDIRDDPVLLPSPLARPVSRLPDLELRLLMHAPGHRVRHYRCMRVTGWGGELVLSLYLRFEVAHGRMFCELSSFLLTPLKSELHRSDRLPPEPEPQDVLRLAWRSLILMPVLSLRAPFALLRPSWRERRRAKQLQLVERDAFFDYGATENVLERVRLGDYARYFQMLDKEMYAKVLERAILDAIVDVLDAHDIDAGELVERRSTIINNGLMIQGGSVEAENVAVGTGAGIFSRAPDEATAAAASRAGGKT